MAVGIWWLTKGGVAGGRIWGCSWGRASHGKAVLYEGDAKTGTRAILGGVGGVEEIGEEKADQLEGHAYHTVPDEGEERADGEAFVEDFVGGHARGQDGSFPVGRSGICSCLFVGLESVLAYSTYVGYGTWVTYGWLFLELLSMFRLGTEVCEDAVIRRGTSTTSKHSDWRRKRTRCWSGERWEFCHRSLYRWTISAIVPWWLGVAAHKTLSVVAIIGLIV